MRVRVRDSALTKRVPELEAREPADQIHLTEGREYDVHAICVFEGTLDLQIIDDLTYPSWQSVWYFETVDRSIPPDWICSIFGGEPSLVIGPEFVARDIASYEAMVSLEKDQVEEFWKRVREVEGTQRDEELAAIIRRSDAWIPADQRQDMLDLVRAGEAGIAFENCCMQLFEYDAVISRELLEQLRRIGEQMGIDRCYWARLAVEPSPSGD